MLPVLEAWADQPVPKDVELDREAWVTLHPPDKELCDTWQTAIAAAGFEAHEAPKGKLAARNKAHDHAFEEAEADVVVVADADAPPLRQDTLVNLLEPFTDEDVVATNSNPVSTGMAGKVVNLFARFEDETRPQMHGQCSAITDWGWEEAGPFDTDLDQTRIEEVRDEEEFRFRDRLKQWGTVEDVEEAVVENDTRRVACSVPRAMGRFTSKYPNSDYCQRHGVETFNIREE